MVRNESMICVLLEQEYNEMNSVEAEFISKFKSSSVKRLGNEKQNKMDLSIFDEPPLFDDAWLIICSSASKKLLDELSPDKNVILIKVTRKSALQNVLDRLDGFEYQFIDNYKIDKDVMKKWICEQLKVDEAIATYLYNRTGANTKAIAESVRLLSVLPEVTRAAVRDCIPKAHRVTIYSMVQYLLGIASRVEYSEIMQMLYDFRYASKWLQKSLLQELKVYAEVYNAMDSGELTLQNYREYRDLSNIKSIRGCADYRLRNLIESHNYVSSELVYYLIFRIKSLRRGPDFLAELIKLFEVGGNDVYSM